MWKQGTILPRFLNTNPVDEINDYIRELRKDYDSQLLDETSVLESPFRQFGKWMQEAINAKVNEPNAVTLSTVSARGRPSSRIVLLRELNEEGFIFFTNYNSRKMRDLTVNPFAGLSIFWPELERQIRIEGIAEKVAEGISDAYFQSRPRDSQIGAWASDQSEALQTREELEKKILLYQEKFEGHIVPRPPHWGGICIRPDYFEFWQGRASRLHDRICYTNRNDSWIITRLSP